MQKLLILAAAVIFATAGVLVGMSYKRLFPSSDENPPAAAFQTEQPAAEKQPPADEAKTKEILAEETTAKETMAEETGTKIKPVEPKPAEETPLAVMEELIETQFEEIENLKNQIIELMEENQTQVDKIQNLESKTGGSDLQTEPRNSPPEPVVLLGDELFSPGQVTLSLAGLKSINQLAAKITSQNKYRVMVCGHTDDTNLGTAKTKLYGDNLGLSVARALEAARGLIAEGVPPELIGVCGYGDSRPSAPNTTPPNMARNRRVTVSFIPLDKE